MKLYSGPLSLFTAKVRIALDEKGIPYDKIEVPFSKRGYVPKHPDVVRYNPKQQVPVLVDDDLVLYDSTLILEYLEDRNPEPPLYPRDIKGRARCRQSEAAADEILFPHVLELIREVFYKPNAADRDSAKIAAATAGILAYFDGLDAQLSSGREYICGDFSVADIAHFLTLMFASSLGVTPKAEQTNIAAWMARVGARPSVSREAAAMMSYRPE